jgi:hypothetical protein
MGRQYKKPVTFSYDEIDYTISLTNKAILKLNLELIIAQQNVKSLIDKLHEIQENCAHEFKFTSTGMYEDYYECIHCGFETYK